METISEEITSGVPPVTSCISSGSATDVGTCFYTSGDKMSAEERSEYYSARLEELLLQSGDRDVESEIGRSKPDWSEVTYCEEVEKQVRENMKEFEELRVDPETRRFFYNHSFQLGKKIAEGGQAEIYELEVGSPEHAVTLMKVFKRGLPLQLRKICPIQVLKNDVRQCIRGGWMSEDGRFAFLMKRCWGDLRKLIDLSMQAKKEAGIQGPPFPVKWKGADIHAEDMIWQVLEQMERLHEKGVVHRDLKAANILLLNPGELIWHWKGYTTEYPEVNIIVADFECSIGVLGTGFWRAPEILSAIENKKVMDIRVEEWKKADVYSFGMTVFEIVTGRSPFEGELENTRAGREAVIAGKRPKLPSDLHPGLKDLITKCWDPNPNLRPSFFEILMLGMPLWPKYGYFRLVPTMMELPNGYRLATVQEVRDHPEQLKRAMPGWQIANLADGSVDVDPHGCEIRPGPHEGLSYKLITLCDKVSSDNCK